VEAKRERGFGVFGKAFRGRQGGPVIDRRYPLHEVPEALRYLEGEPHLGKLSSWWSAEDTFSQFKQLGCTFEEPAVVKA
jgi:hypothetical protein